MFNQTLLQEIATVARELEVEPAALAAVAHIESGLKTHALVDGRPEPLIRFEGHYFDRRLAGAARERARAEGLAAPRAGVVRNPAGQAQRWRLLARAAAIDRKAAYESVSWGIGQVMGAHWAWLGFASVDALVAEARDGTLGQLRLMARFIAKSGLAQALRAHDWAAFARGYNGPAYRRNAYDTKLAAAYQRYASPGDGGVATSGFERVLRRGSRGNAVRRLQLALRETGAELDADGFFGTRTEAALRDYQASNGLKADGIAGRATWHALSPHLPLETSVELDPPIVLPEIRSAKGDRGLAMLVERIVEAIRDRLGRAV